jgi:hypothetical protein
MEAKFKKEQKVRIIKVFDLKGRIIPDSRVGEKGRVSDIFPWGVGGTTQYAYTVILDKDGSETLVEERMLAPI